MLGRTRIIILFASFLFVLNTQGQKASFSQIMADLGRMQQNFLPTDSGYISCSIQYLYSKESTPTIYTDSIKGIMKAYQSFRYSKIMNTETLENDSMVLSVYNDSKTIVATPAVRKKGDQRILLLSMDSSFIINNVASATVADKNGQRTLSLTFNDSSLYYRCTMIYDTTNYFPRGIAYILRSTKLSESGKPAKDGGVITIRFTNYSTAPFNTAFLNTDSYVIISTRKLKAAYAGYTLYVNGAIGKN